MILLTRDEFREGVFKRDNRKCVICGQQAADAHHIIERRLWPDGGYYLDNGVSVCLEHHLKAESTELSCEQIRESAGIKETIIPPQLYSDYRYDKWANPYTPEGMRWQGPLFTDPNVRKILVGDFLPYIKYPRTFHLPWSPGTTKDDRVMKDISGLLGKDVLITEKMDGENTTMYPDYIHARSFNYDSHPSRDRIKALHAQICGDIPKGFRICGENLYAKHSILYEDLEDFFLVFSIWDGTKCLDWTSTEEWCTLLELKHIPVLSRKEHFYNAEDLLHAGAEVLGKPIHEVEGYVVRPEGSFDLKEFNSVVGKYVRKDHVQSSHHWKFETVVPNKVNGH